MRILKRVSSIKHTNLQALVAALLVMVVSFGPWVSVLPQEMSNGTPTVIVPTSAPIEPAPAAAVPETPATVELAPVPPAPVETAPPVEDVPAAPAEPAPAVDEPVEVALPPTDVPVAPVEPEPAVDEPVEEAVPPTEAAIILDAHSDESEDAPVEMIGNDPVGEMIVTPEAPVPTIVATAPPTPTPTAVPSPTPSPTVVPSPTPEPTPVITWSQPEPIGCLQHAGDPQSLAKGDTATWRCHISIAADTTGEAPKDLHVLWQIDVDYAGDDVRLSLPSGTVASVLVPDSSPGGTNELVTYRTNWADGQSLTFDVTVTRTSCLVGETQLAISAGIDVKTAENNVQITRSGESPVKTHLVSVAAPNQDALVVSMQPVEFGKLEWDGKTWGTAYAASTVTVSNVNPCATSQAYLVQVEVVTSNPGMTPVIASASVPKGLLVPVAITDQNTAVVGIASVPVGFEGTAEVDIQFVLSPALEVDPGSHTVGFQVAVVPAP